MTGVPGNGLRGLGGGFLGFMFQGAGRLGSQGGQAARQNQHVVDQQLSDLIAGRQITASEILSRQRGIAQQEAQWNNHNTHQIPLGEGAAGLLIQPNMFTRWLDIRDSEDELQEFLTKCVHYGARYRTIAPMSVEKLESNNE